MPEDWLPLYKLQIGLSAHAYLTATGKATAGEDTTIVLPQSQHQPMEFMIDTAMVNLLLFVIFDLQPTVRMFGEINTDLVPSI